MDVDNLEKEVTLLHRRALLVILGREIALRARLNARVHGAIKRADKFVEDRHILSCFTSVTRTSARGACEAAGFREHAAAKQRSTQAAT